MKSQTFNIPANPVEAHKIVTGAIWKSLKALTMAGNRVAVRICDPEKSRDQEEKYHAMIAEIAAQIPVGGRNLDDDTMKRLLVDQFKADTLVDMADDWKKFGTMEMAPSLDGQRVVVLGVQTRRFTVRLGSAFIEWLYAYGSDAGVVFTERTLDPETGEIVTCRREPRQLEAA
jgi:hypothetical protein